MDMNLEKADGTERIEQLRAFLLGTLAESDAERVEYGLLSDDGLYELLLAAEEELIDEYLSGSLTQSEASSFLGYLDKLPDGSRRIDFARDLRESLESPERSVPTRSRWEAAAQGFAQRVRWHRSAWAAALALVVVALSMVLWRPSPEPATVLTAGMTRGEGEIPTVTLPSSSRVLTVLLDLGTHSHDRYRATLYDADSRAILSSGGLAASVTDLRILVPFPIPVSGLEPGDYSIALDGETTSGGYEPIERYVLRFIK
jgi:hypothetical protein